MTRESSSDGRALLRHIASYGLPGPEPGPKTDWSSATSVDIWRRLLDEVDRRRLAGLFQAALDEGAGGISLEQRRDLADVHLRWCLTALDLEVALLEAVELLSAADIEVVVLKGAAHAHQLYPDPSWRLFGDNDLLLRGEQFGRAVELLHTLGYERTVPELRRGFDRRFGKGATLRGPDGVELDLHRTLLFGTFGLRIETDELFRTSRSIDLGGTQLRVLGPETRLLHLCYHAALGDPVPKLATLRDLAQAVALGGYDEQVACGLARRWGALPVVRRAFDLLRSELDLSAEGRLAEAARMHEAGPADRRAIAAYVGPTRGHTTKALASLPYLGGPVDRARFLVSATLPRRTVRRVIGDDRRAWLARGATALRRQRAVPPDGSNPRALDAGSETVSDEPGGGIVKTRVLWLTKGLGLGGAERLLTLTASRLDPSRFEVHVAYLLPWKDALVPELEAAGVRTTCLGAGRTADPRWLSRLHRELAAGRYDVVHTHSPVPAAVARLLVRRPTRLVHTEHNLWPRYRWPTFAVNALTYARNDAVLAVSDGVASSIVRPRWARIGRPPPVETLLHGVDPAAAVRGDDARAAAREALDLELGTPVLGCVANLTPKKDHAALLEALVHVRSVHPDVVLLLIGTGPIEEDLRQKVAALDLVPSVRFLGTRTDVPDLLPAFDVFVLSSRYEGLPISLLEAMASEVACVVTRVGGVPEVLTDEIDGRLVEAGDPLALSAALLEVLGDDDARARLARTGRERVTAAFSIDRAVDRTEQLYDELLGR